MSSERPTLAELIRAHQGTSWRTTPAGWVCECGDLYALTAQSAAHAAQQHAVHVADAVAEWVRDRLADEALVEALIQRPECEHEREIWREHEYASHCAPCDVAVVAEHLGAS